MRNNTHPRHHQPKFVAKVLLTGVAIASASFSAIGPSTLLAQKVLAQEESYPPNPLNTELESDPLIPELLVDRPLSPQELRVFKSGVNQLSRQGEEIGRAHV